MIGTETTMVTQTATGTLMRVPLLGMKTPRKDHFKCTVVGDSQCGKTSILRSYTTRLTFPYTVESSRPLPSQYPVKQMVQGREHTATVTDTDCTDIESRITAYNRADVVVVCFSLVNRSSFKNVKDKWLPELEQYCPNTPIVLVGTKSDLVHSSHVKRKDIVTVQQIEQLLTYQRIHKYCESSALTKDGLSTVFEETFNAAWIGPVRYVARMKTVHSTKLNKLKGLIFPCIYTRTK